MQTYYIETSIGRIEFMSDNLPSLEVDCHCHTKYTNIIPVDEELFRKFLSRYITDEIYTVSTNNGLFLTMNLSDEYYGVPEFKIFTKVD